MALVTISEASRLTGKNRTTIYRHMQQGKLSQTTDDTGSQKLDTAELLRVYGSFVQQLSNNNETVAKQHEATANATELELLQQENKHLLQLLTLKDELIAEKDSRIKLLEYKQPNAYATTVATENATKSVASKKWWKFWK